MPPFKVVSDFARIVEPELPESGVRYTRAVTWVWCGFFAVNGAIATWTALYADWPLWTLYNGLIAYIAIAVLFAGEMLVRGGAYYFAAVNARSQNRQLVPAGFRDVTTGIRVCASLKGS